MTAVFPGGYARRRGCILSSVALLSPDRSGGVAMAQRCGNCGDSIFRLRRSELGVEAECATCGAVIPLYAAPLKNPQRLQLKAAAKSSEEAARSLQAKAPGGGEVH